MQIIRDSVATLLEQASERASERACGATCRVAAPTLSTTHESASHPTSHPLARVSPLSPRPPPALAQKPRVMYVFAVATPGDARGDYEGAARGVWNYILISSVAHSYYESLLHRARTACDIYYRQLKQPLPS